MALLKLGPSRTNRKFLGLASSLWFVSAFLNIFFRTWILPTLLIVGVVSFLIASGAFAFRPPIEFSFLVGESQQHEIKFLYSPNIGETKIYVDGEKQLVKQEPWYSKRHERFEITIGAPDTHQLVIIRNRKFLGSYLHETEYDIFVDGSALTRDQVFLLSGKESK